MALSLMDGTTANIAFALDSNEYTCQMASVAVEFTRNTFTRITFCSANWMQNINGMKGARFVATGYPGKGTSAAKPGQYFLADSYPAMLFTADTGCTIGMTVAMTRESIGMIAASNGSYSLEGVNHDDDLAVTWVTS